MCTWRRENVTATVPLGSPSSDSLLLSWKWPPRVNMNEFRTVVHASKALDFRVDSRDDGSIRLLTVEEAREAHAYLNVPSHEEVVFFRLALQSKLDVSKRGPWLSLLKPWNTVSSCDNFKFLNDSASDPMDWTCDNARRVQIALATYAMMECGMFGF